MTFRFRMPRRRPHAIHVGISPADRLRRLLEPTLIQRTSSSPDNPIDRSDDLLRSKGLADHDTVPGAFRFPISSRGAGARSWYHKREALMGLCLVSPATQQLNFSGFHYVSGSGDVPDIVSSYPSIWKGMYRGITALLYAEFRDASPRR
jgi:hypothetical protein